MERKWGAAPIMKNAAALRRMFEWQVGGYSEDKEAADRIRPARADRGRGRHAVNGPVFAGARIRPSFAPPDRRPRASLFSADYPKAASDLAW